MLGAHVTPYDPATQSMFAQMRGGVHGGRRRRRRPRPSRAYAALFGMVQRQATMVSFVGIFQLLGVIFLVLIPLVLLMKRPKRGAAPAAARTETVAELAKLRSSSALSLRA